MKKFRKRLLTLIMAVIMVFTGVPLTAAAAQSAGSFRDVDSDDYYYNPVLWAIQNQVTSGTTPTTFSPKDDCTRGQIVTFLYNAAKGSPDENAKAFEDVGKEKYYYNPVSWAVGKKITSGTTDTTFSPNASCTRAEAVTFLWNRAGKPEGAFPNSFSDVKSDKWYAKAVNWAVANKVTAGTSEDTFSPNKTCTRAEIVTLLYNNSKNASHSTGGSGSSGHSVKPEAQDNLTVTFMKNDASDDVYQMTEVKRGSRVAEPAAPELDGYKFLGWYLSPDGEESYNFSSPVLTDLFLYARWGSPDGSEGIYGTSSGGGTDFSITDIERNGSNFDVTINADYAAILLVQILDENNTDSVLAEGASYTPNYCETTPVSVSVDGEIPEHFIVRARIIDADENDLCDPFETIRFTTRYAEYDAKTIYDFADEGTVVNFDDSSKENFGVLADGIQILNTEGNTNQVTLKYDEERDEDGDISAYRLAGYQITNPDQTVKELQAGDRIMAVLADGNAVMFKIASITAREDGSYYLTQDNNCSLTDFYTYLKVDMTLTENGNPETAGAQAAAPENETPETVGAQAAVPEAEDMDSTEDALTGAGHGIEIIDISGAKVSASLSSEPLKTAVPGHTEWQAKTEISGTFTIEVSLHYDVKILGKDYFDFKLQTELEGSGGLALLLTGEAKDNSGSKITYKSKGKTIIPDVSVPTTVPGLLVDHGTDVTTSVTFTAEVDVTFNFKNTSGLTYDSNTKKWHKIEKKDRGIIVNPKGEVELKHGIREHAGVSIGATIDATHAVKPISAEIYAEVGAKATLTAEGPSYGETDAEDKHACTLCASGAVEWYVDVGADVKYCIVPDKLEGTIIDDKITAKSGSIKLPGSPEGKIFISIINSPDSIYQGKPHFGAGSCENKQYRTTIRAKDLSGNNLNENITVLKADGTQLETKKTPFAAYLYNGKYYLAGMVNGKHIEKTIVVSSAAQTVNLTADSGDGEITGRVLSAETGDPIDKAAIVLSDGDTEVAAIESDSNGQYSKKVPAGQYKITISKEGYTTFTENVTISEGTATYVPSSLMVSASSWKTARGGFSGTIRDSVSNEPIQGVSLDLRSGWNASEDEDILGTLTTDENGFFIYDIRDIFGLTWGLKPGNYSLSAKKKGYADISFNIIVMPGTVKEGQDATMSTVTADGVYRVVLNWGDEPGDLDSHYRAETSDNVTEHIYYANSGGISANLDRDDVDSFGPETITIDSAKLKSGFTYSVHDFSNRGDDQDTQLAASSASVTVYNGNHKLQTYYVPTGKVGNVWNVFSVDANGNLIPINTFESEEDPGSVGGAA